MRKLTRFIQIGLKSWPAIYAYPDQKSSQWPSIISLLMDAPKEMEGAKRAMMYYDPTINVTYNMMQIEEKLYIAVLYARDTRKNESINEFMVAITDHLKNVKVFEKLTTKMS